MVEENVMQINGGITKIVAVSVKNVVYVKKNYIWNPSACSFENEKYLASIMDDSAITCDENIKSNDKETNFNEKKGTCKTQNFSILLAFLLITIPLSIDLSKSPFS